MRRKFLTPTGLVATGIALATLLTLAFAAGGRDNVVRRVRAAAQRLEAGDVVFHDYDVPDPVVATIGTVVDDLARFSSGQGKVVALATVVDRVAPTQVVAAATMTPVSRLHSESARHTSDRAPPVL